MNDPKKIAIMRTDRIGEVLLSTIAIDAAKERYPGARITFVTSEYSKSIVEDRTDVEEVITVDTKNKKGWLRKAVDLSASLRERKIDMVIVLNPHKVLHLASFLAGAPLRAGYDRKWGFLLNEKIGDERDKGAKHEVEYTLDLLRVLGMDLEKAHPLLPIRKGAEESLMELFRKKGINLSKPIIAVHPGSSNPVKIWPAERYAELIRKIRAETGCQIAILGTEDERALSESIAKKADSEIIDLVGVLDLKELAAFLKKTKLFIGNDTGPMHMAAALDVPVIAIFRQEAPGAGPKRWGPWGERHTVFHEKAEKEVTVDEVFKAVKKIL